MKKYLFILAALIVLGLVLAYLSFTQQKGLNNARYLDTTNSIRELKVIDSEMNQILYRIFFERADEYDQLEERMTDLIDVFDHLRYEVLFNEIENSEALDSATFDFDSTLQSKSESVEEIVEVHQSFVASHDKFIAFVAQGQGVTVNSQAASLYLHYLRYLGRHSDDSESALQEKLKEAQQVKSLAASALIETVKTDKKATIENTQVEGVPNEGNGPDLDYVGWLAQKLDILEKAIELNEAAKELFVSITEEKTNEKINVFEEAYANYHTKAIEGLNTIRIAWLIYGFVLLFVLAFFALLLRRHYSHLEQEVSDRTQEIEKAYQGLQESQEQLIQSEKMASLGSMVAGVAHEINTPLGYVGSNVETIHSNFQDVQKLMSRVSDINNEARKPNSDKKKIIAYLGSLLYRYENLEIDDLKEESEQLLLDSGHGLKQISELVQSLKDFSRLDRKSTSEIDIHSCIENSLKVASGPIADNKVEVEKVFGVLPGIVCMPSKLNQLFLNIITNAAQAMKGSGGRLSIKTELIEQYVSISFTDEGVGMDDHTSKKMFDPFFTSKPIGEGTGLGMSIAYKIVKAHEGEIHVESKPGAGTVISVLLPVAMDQTKA